MIFGNPGFGDNEGFNGFSIQVDNILDSDFVTLNLCMDMEIYPSSLAYNLNTIFFASLRFGKDTLFHIDDELYSLTDNDLMIELIRRTFNFSYQMERMILENKIDIEIHKTPDELSSFLYDHIEESSGDRRFWWDIDTFEYTKKGVHPFLISNSKGKTKVVIITEKINEEIGSELSRFFTDDLVLKNDLIFFDKDYWSIKVIELDTNYLKEIIDEASLFIERLINKQ